MCDRKTDCNTVLRRRLSGERDSRCTDRVEELSRQLLKFLSLSLSLTHTHTHVRTHARTHTHTHAHTHTHTHTPLPYSFLASDSRHPVMTWGVSLAASKAALNRQKYLLWQTDRPSPTTTYMQLSLSLLLLLPALWFDFPLMRFSPSIFFFFLFKSFHILSWKATPTFRTLCLAPFGWWPETRR